MGTTLEYRALARWEEPPSGVTHRAVADVAVDAQDRVYVYSRDNQAVFVYGNARVHHFSADGALVGSWGAPGIGPGEFMVPHGIALAADGRVLVADRDNRRIQIFSGEGRYLEQWTGFSHPTGVFVHRSGRVYVSEIGWEFDSSASAGDESVLPLRLSVLDASGALIARWTSSDDGPLGCFAAPHGLCVDSRGDIYVASNNRRRRGRAVQKLALAA